MLRRLARRLLGRSKRSPTASAPKQAPVQAAPSPPAPTTETTSDAAPARPSRTDHVLALYKYDACPYCRRVQRVLDTLDLHVEMRDTRLHPEHRQALFERTGRTQVPCLFIDGEPKFESEDIVDWLEDYAARV